MHATYNAWEEEARALRHIEKLNHNHITKCIAAIRRGDRRYFMFPWAEGGSLQDFWESVPYQDPNAGLILQTIQQLRWLADALDVLHNCDSGNSDRLAVPSMPNSTEDGKNIRHGDLKPENILRFFSRNTPESSSAEPQLGTLKIADMGLAKQHIHATVNRTKNTSQRYGTVRYEAPEALNEKGGRSRLYDVWSMGCITLEFVIWLLYGNKALEEFHAQVGGPTKQACQYFEGKPPKVHHVVTNWISHILQRDPECTQNSAIKDLLELVSKRLLVVSIDSRRDSLFARPVTKDTTSTFRATAAEFRDSLDTILSRLEDRPSSYLCTGKPRRKNGLPKGKEYLVPYNGGLQVPQRLRSNSAAFEGVQGVTERAIREYSVRYLPSDF